MFPNLALRWLTFNGGISLLFDGLLVAFIVRRTCTLARVCSKHPVVRWLRYGVVFVLVVVVSAWVLSAVHRLGWRGFVVVHLAFAGLLAAVWRRKGDRARSAPGLSRALFLCGDDRGPPNVNRLQRILLPLAGWMFVGVLIYLLALAAGTFAMNWDSQTYRLPRVGYWLQEGWISMKFANESRLFFMPVNAELCMAWLTCFFPSGYPMVNLVQYFGGCLTLLSIGEIGRLSGLSREGRLLAAFLALGVPVVFMEFATSQSDLIAGGLLNCGLVFLWRSLRGRTFPDVIFAGLAIGLSFGTKGTVFYWIPGLGIWVILLLLIHRPGFRRAIALLGIASTVILLIGGWKYADNWRRFGNPFAPSGDISRVRHIGGGGRGGGIRVRRTVASLAADSA